MASTAKLFRIYSILCVYLGLAAAEKVMRPNFNDVKLWSDEKHISHKITYEPTDPHINITLHVLQDLKDVDIHVELRFVQKKDPTYFFMTNTTMNLCRLFGWRNLSALGSLIHTYLSQYGNMIEKCPVAKGKYYIHKFWYPEDVSIATLPEFDFEIHVSAYHLETNHKREMILDDHIKGEGAVKDVNNVKSGIFALLPKVR